MYVIGTAGHVDHGKSTLVTALTGIDPDRLQEEKERGMTIDLGFAWLKLLSGREVSIVDVPGHERFIKNMLAGVGGIDLALLVIAADEGVMPQTREHLAILDLLQVHHGAIVITKRDLVDDDWLELVEADIAESVDGTTFEDKPIFTVSSATGQGIPELLAGVDRLLEETPPRRDVGRPRLPIDRVFSVAGFGTVVTGTLIDGSLRLGQEVEVLPSNLRSRVRGLQTHRHKVEVAVPGSRVAVNLQGLATADLARGDVLTTPGWLRPTDVVDVKLRAVGDLPRPIRHNFPVSFHSGAAEAIGRVRLLDRNDVRPGETAWAQIKLDSPIVVAKGDFFIVRSTDATIGGGEVVDPHPKRHRRLHEGTLTSLETMAAGSPEDRLLQALQRPEPAEVRSVLDASGLDPAAARPAIDALVSSGEVIVLSPAGPHRSNSHLVSAAAWAKLTAIVTDILGAYHRQYPLRVGMGREELKSRLKLGPRAFSEVVARLVAEGDVAEDGTTVRLSAHLVRLTPTQRAQADAFIRSLEANPYSPPNEHLPDDDLLAALQAFGEVVRVGDVVFSAKAYREMVDGVREHIRERGKITVAEFRDRYQTSRKYALALLEHLDDERITMRIGDERVLRET